MKSLLALLSPVDSIVPPASHECRQRCWRFQKQRGHRGCWGHLGAKVTEVAEVAEVALSVICGTWASGLLSRAIWLPKQVENQPMWWIKVDVHCYFSLIALNLNTFLKPST